jgi:cobalt-zinc-cadmium efflux system protein
MASDVAALTVALVAQVLVGRPATTRHSYGLQRAEVLGAQANGLLLVAAAGWIVYAAIGRIGDPPDIPGGGLLAIAVVGLAVNIVSAVWLARARGGSLNMHGAFLHMALDAVGSVAVVVTAVAIIVWDATWMDPVASLAIAALILWSAFGLLRDAAHVLLEGTPRGMWPAEVEASLLDDPEVEAVHHLHLWNLASDVPALSAHVVLRGEVSLHEAQASSDRLKTLLEARHGITHATLELECHPCDPEDAGHR